MDKIQSPGTLSFAGNVAENWRKWKQRFELYLTASGIDAKDQKIQSATLLHVASQEALEIYNTFTWDKAGDDKNVPAIMAKFEAYCNPRKNVTWERHIFNTRTRNQQPGETIDQYVTDLRTKTCEFGTLIDGCIRDRIVGGIIDDSMRNRLLQKADLTLEKAIDMCRSSEMTAAQMKTLTASQEPSPTSRQLTSTQLERADKGAPMTSTSTSVGGAALDTRGNRHAQRLVLSASNVDDEIILQESASRKHKARQDLKRMELNKTALTRMKVACSLP